MLSPPVVVTSSQTGHKRVLLFLTYDASHFYLIVIVKYKILLIWVESWNQVPMQRIPTTFAFWWLLKNSLGLVIWEWPIFLNSNHAQGQFLAYSNTGTQCNIIQHKPFACEWNDPIPVQHAADNRNKSGVLLSSKTPYVWTHHSAHCIKFIEKQPLDL